MCAFCYEFLKLEHKKPNFEHEQPIQLLSRLLYTRSELYNVNAGGHVLSPPMDTRLDLG